MFEFSSFERIQGQWTTACRSALKGNEAVLDGIEKLMLGKLSRSKELFNSLSDVSRAFIRLSHGEDCLGEYRSDCAGDKLKKYLNKYFKINSVSELPDLKAALLSSIISDIFFLGLYTYLASYDRNGFNRYKGSNSDHYLEEFFGFSHMAYFRLRRTNKNLRNLPNNIFNEYSQTIIYPVVNVELKIGLFRLWFLNSHFRNMFFAGFLLGFIAESDASVKNF